jgi:uncharacterized peroxidase-related enzyme
MPNRPRIQTGNQLPGIKNALQYSPTTAEPLNVLLDTLLRSQEGLSRGERELVMAVVSRSNSCDFCYRVHSQMAALQLPNGPAVLAEFESNGELPSPRLVQLAYLAKVTAINGMPYYDPAIQSCREAGLSDREIHDIIVIASTASMVNRYVEAIDAPYPTEPEFFRGVAEKMMVRGYLSDRQLAERAAS